MLTRYFVTYDICAPDRLRRVYELMRGFGDHMQYSVFRCDLSDRQIERMKLQLEREIKADEDQVLIIDIGPSDGRGSECVSALGLAYTHPERHAVVV